MVVLESSFPAWRRGRIHESSPGGAASDKLRRECPGYVPTYCFPDVPAGQRRDGHRCEDLEEQTFSAAAFDLVVTQDVLEHVLDPARAFREIARTLEPGGAHVFTVPWREATPTLVRAHRTAAGVEHLEAPEYHGNPIDPAGSLVVREWGWDLPEFVLDASGMATTVMRIVDRRQGLVGDGLEVFVSRKRPS